MASTTPSVMASPSTASPGGWAARPDGGGWAAPAPGAAYYCAPAGAGAGAGAGAPSPSQGSGEAPAGASSGGGGAGGPGPPLGPADLAPPELLQLFDLPRPAAEVPRASPRPALPLETPARASLGHGLGGAPPPHPGSPARAAEGPPGHPSRRDPNPHPPPPPKPRPPPPPGPPAGAPPPRRPKAASSAPGPPRTRGRARPRERRQPGGLSEPGTRDPGAD